MPTKPTTLPPHMLKLLEKAKAYDERHKASFTDVTPAGYGPGEDTFYDPAKDPERLPPPDPIAVNRLRNEIAEGETILRGKVSGAKRKAIEKTVAGAKEKLRRLQEHEPAKE